ncbi:MAG: deoxyribonuclease IV [Bacilli bacterium]
MKIGSHVSMSGGLKGAVKESISYNASTFMIYTGAPQNTVRKPVEQMEIEEGYKLMKQHNIEGFVVHAPYIINLASPKDSTYTLAKDFLKIEIERTNKLGSKYLVLHPGSYTESSKEEGIKRIIDGLNEIIDENQNVIICLETMAGKGSEIGSKFQELKTIIDGVKFNSKIGICFDTCHVHDSGYDIVNDLDSVMKEFDSIIGLNRIKVFHLNGSLNVKGSKKDRHANLSADETNPKGIDNIGIKTIKKLVHSNYAKDKFLILETPWISKTENLYKQEIKLLREI